MQKKRAADARTILNTPESVYDHVFRRVPEIILNALNRHRDGKALEAALWGDRKAVKEYNSGKTPEDYLNLAVVIFGLNKGDPRRKEWERVSKPWGLGNLRALDRAGIMKRGTRIKNLDNPSTLDILEAIYLLAIKAHDERGFDVWLESRVIDATGLMLKGGKEAQDEEELQKRYELIKSLQWSMSYLSLEQLQSLKASVEAMQYSPQAAYHPWDDPTELHPWE